MKTNPKIQFMKHKLLYTIALGLILYSCSTQKKVKTNVQSLRQTTLTTKIIEKPKIETKKTADFFTQNISTTIGDNTTSYGSIVSANPYGFAIEKKYFPSLAQNFRIKYIILHYTVLDDEASIRTLTQKAVSAHYLVNDSTDNKIYQLVDENKRAYHAGISSWKKDNNLNDLSIGIEIVNRGFVVENDQKKFFSFPDYQIKKVAQLVLDIAKRYDIAPTKILGHSDIAPTRKQDPGGLFPWKLLYNQYNIGMWYDESDKNSFLTSKKDSDFETEANSSYFITNFQTHLAQLGYGIAISGVCDDATKKTIEAFQYHFRPEKNDGIMDLETWAILQALNKKYPN